MRYNKLIIFLSIFLSTFLWCACNGTKNLDDAIYHTTTKEGNESDSDSIHYLALGDSYTIGESVAANANFPHQLEKALEPLLNARIKTSIVATTGWRTDNLLTALEKDTAGNAYDLVTLLIGVNNQYQGVPLTVYEKEFPQLLEKALRYAGHSKEKVFVISIPDWGYTPFAEGRDRENISKEIDAHNSFAKVTATELGVTFISITDITREGLTNTALVAPDGLHPSALAYERFVARMLPIISKQLKD